MLDESELAAVALTSRLVDSPVKPLSSREFWAMSQHTELSALRGRTATEMASELAVADETGERIGKLLDRVAALALAIEKLDHSGIWTITGIGRHYPERVRTRLGQAAPVVLHGVGNTSLLETDGVGVVGSRNVTDEGSQVAREIAEVATKSGLPVVSGAARGVDREAMNGAIDVGGQVVGVLADAMERVVNRPGTRRAVAQGQVCLITPYAPAAPFSVGNAMGRNKIIYALSRCTIVVASDHHTGGTWSGAAEALKNFYGRVIAWTGPGSGSGNSALVKQGAIALEEIPRLDELLGESAGAQPAERGAETDQLTLGF